MSYSLLDCWFHAGFDDFKVLFLMVLIVNWNWMDIYNNQVPGNPFPKL
jgi:hypothetical protein